MSILADRCSTLTHELVAKAVRQHELRALAYLTSKVPIDQPLAPVQIPRLSQLPCPPRQNCGSSVSLLDDIAKALGVNNENLSAWRGRLLGDLYREENLWWGSNTLAAFGGSRRRWR